MSGLKRLARYVNGTFDFKLFLTIDRHTLEAVRRGDITRLIGKTDADWAGDVEERKSTNCTFVMWGGFLISCFASFAHCRHQSQNTTAYAAQAQN
jgi:hypothetical protein